MKAKAKEIFMQAYAIRNYQGKDDEQKSQWTEIGVGFANADGSVNLLLNMLPLPNPKTGQIEINLRMPKPKEEKV